MYNFGNVLSSIRKKNGFMQYQVAEELGYCSMTINLIEQGKNLPSEKLLQKLVGLLCINTDDAHLLYDAYSLETRKFPSDTTVYFKAHSNELCKLVRALSESNASDDIIETLVNSL